MSGLTDALIKTGSTKVTQNATSIGTSTNIQPNSVNKTSSPLLNSMIGNSQPVPTTTKPQTNIFTDLIGKIGGVLSQTLSRVAQTSINKATSNIGSGIETALNTGIVNKPLVDKNTGEAIYPSQRKMAAFGVPTPGSILKGAGEFAKNYISDTSVGMDTSDHKFKTIATDYTSNTFKDALNAVEGAGKL